MKFLQLRACVSYGLVGGRPVFVDLRRDRYFALDPVSEQAFLDLRSDSEAIVPTGSARERLLATGLFQESALRGRLAPTVAPRPRESLLDEPLRRPGWITAWRVWRTVARARERRAATSLWDLVDGLREARLAARPHGGACAAEAAARQFAAARPLVPIERNCLLDSLALLDWLGEAAGHAKLVFGVRLDPFGAHCWLQTDDRLLTDAHDLVGNFTPVLAV